MTIMHSMRRAEDVAQNILNKYGMGSVPINPVRIAELEGVKVFDAFFPNPEVSGLVVKESDSPKIYVKTSDSPLRKRFTVAHELGHVCLHLKDEAGNFIDNEISLYRMSSFEESLMTQDPFNYDEDRLREMQANQFAAALLMPREAVKNEWDFSKSVESMAFIFGVSLPAMTNRLRNMGLIDG